MRPQALLSALAVVAVLAAALPLARANPFRSAAAPPSASWPCCDKCGSCTRSIPPQCTCMDMSPTGCSKDCKTCVNSTDGFRCRDRVVNLCKRRCTSAA